MKKNKYWAVYDEQTHNYLHSGRNTKSLKRAVDEVWSFWIGGADLEHLMQKRLENGDGNRKKIGSKIHKDLDLKK